MDGSEFFSPSGAAESYDPAAFERFKEQIKKNGQIAAAIRKDEQSKKKKEDALYLILLAFIKRNQNSALMIIVSMLLEENIPASFILAIIVLGHPEIKDLIAEQERTQLLLEQAEAAKAGITLSTEPALLPENFKKIEGEPGPFSLMVRFNDSTVPLQIRIALDEWGVGIYQAGSAQPFRILEVVQDKEGHIKKVAIDACANVLQTYLTSVDSGTFGVRGYESFYSFSEFMLKGILQKLKEQIENQKQLN